MPNPTNLETYEEQLDAIRERLDLAEHEMVRVRMSFQTLLVLARNLAELVPVLADAVRDIAAGLDMDLDEDMEDEPDGIEGITVGGVRLEISPTGQVSIDEPTGSAPAGSGD